MSQKAAFPLSKLLLFALWLSTSAAAAYFAWSEPPNPAAPNAIARLESSRGAVSFRSEEFLVWSAVTERQAFAEGDHLSVGDGGSATLVLDGSRPLTLGPNSYLIFERVDRSKAGELEVTLLRGTLQAAARRPAEPGAKVERITVKTQRQIMRLESADARLKLAVTPGAEDTVSEQKRIKTSVRHDVLQAASSASKKAVEASPDVPDLAEKTAKPTPTDAATAALTSNGNLPQLALSVPGSTLWVPAGSTDGMQFPATVTSSGSVPQATGVFLEGKDSSGRVVLKVPVPLKGKRAEWNVSLKAIAAQTSQLPASLSLRPLYATGKEKVPAAPPPVRLAIKLLSSGDARTYALYQADLGGVANRSAALLTKDGAAKSGSRLDVVGSATVLRVLPWLVRSGKAVLEPSAGVAGGGGLIFLKGGALVAKASDSSTWRNQAQRLARIVEASLVISAPEAALAGERNFRHSLTELKARLASDKNLRLYFIVDGKVQSFNPELLVNDVPTMEQLAQRGLGPFAKKIDVVYSQTGGVGH